MKKILTIFLVLIITASISLNMLIAMAMDQHFWSLSLIEAVKVNDTIKVEKLLKVPNKKIDNKVSDFPLLAWWPDFSPVTPIYVATSYGNYEMVKLLIDNGSDIRQIEKHRDSLINSVIPDGVIHDDEDYKMIKILLENGANPYYDNGNGELPIVNAARSSKRVHELVKQSVGEDRFFIDRTGVTPLMGAVVGHNDILVEELVNSGNDVNQQDSNGSSALFYAFYADEIDLYIVDLLLHLGADKNIVDKEGNRPYDLAVRYKGANNKVANMLK